MCYGGENFWHREYGSCARPMDVGFVLVGWVGGRGGDGSGLSAMVDGFFLANNTGEALQNA